MKEIASFGIVLRKEEKPKKKYTDLFVDDDLPSVHRAAANGDIDQMVRDIQEDPSLLEQRSSEGLTPLGQAVLSQQLAAVKRLIKMGANIDAQDNVGRTCLSIAAYQGWHDGVMCLLRNGAKQNICDKSGRFPLHAATYHSDISTMTLLLNGLTAKDVNLPDHELMTAVHWAAFHDRPDHLMLLVQKGGDVLARDIDGKLPLHWATQNCSFQCTHRLTSLNEGLATINEVDFSGKSPAHYAAAAGAANILKILARCENINLEQEDPEERTPLHWAAAMGHSQAVDTLLRLGVNPYPTDIDGCTPVEYALQTQNANCVRVMEVSLGSKAIKKYKQRFLASSQGLPLQESTSDLKYRYSRGQTPKDSPPDEIDANLADIPDIHIQPATTVHSKDTNNVPLQERVGSSPSTDTDVCVVPRNQSPRTSRDVTYEEPLTSRRPKDYSNPLGGAIAKLIGSSFKTGAQAPILSSPQSTDMSNFKNIPTRLEAPYADTPDFPTREDSPEQWANEFGVPRIDIREDSAAEKVANKVKTSTNTPEVNRVSVQSFRSIPAIKSNTVRYPSGRDKYNEVNGPALKGAKFMPLPSIPIKGANAGLSPNALSPRLPQYSLDGQPIPLRVPSRLNYETPPVTTRQERLSLDFMTENVAETRILNRKWLDTLNRLQDRAEAPNYVPLPANKDKTNKTAIKPGANKAYPGPDGSTTGFFKHSRIPSTRMGTHAKASHKNGKEDASASRPSALLTVPERGHKLTSSACSIDLSTLDDKYLHEDDDHAPALPMPLQQQQTPRNSNLGYTPKHLRRSKHKPLTIEKNNEAGENRMNHNSKITGHRSDPAIVSGSNVVESKTLPIQSLLNTAKPGNRARHRKMVQKVAFH